MMCFRREQSTARARHARLVMHCGTRTSSAPTPRHSLNLTKVHPSGVKVLSKTL